MTIDVNWDRVEFVLGVLLNRLEANEYPYDRPDARVTQDHRFMPKNLELGGRAHASFLFHLCYYMRGGIKSNTAVQSLARMHEDCPHLFDFEGALGLSSERLADLLRSFGLGYHANEIAGFWIDNAWRMTWWYNGDPRAIFEGVSTYDQAVKLIKNDGRGGGFYGFREKMVSMLIYFLLDQELIKAFMFPPPVDFHVCRVWHANELFNLGDPQPDENLYVDLILDAIRNTCVEYARRHGKSPLKLSEALWLLSSTICSEQPGNATLEPRGREKRDGRSTELADGAVRPHSQAHRAAYARTCAMCPLEETCRYDIGSGPYYIWGRLVRRRERQRLGPPNVQLALIEDN